MFFHVLAVVAQTAALLTADRPQAIALSSDIGKEYRVACSSEEDAYWYITYLNDHPTGSLNEADRWAYGMGVLCSSNLKWLLRSILWIKGKRVTVPVGEVEYTFDQIYPLGFKTDEWVVMFRWQ